ncbi:MAG TPA: DNA sulfur modification protein DndD [Gemmataceae bacterium]|nr:DNA sulfur modification protein DndD [Gemmataceae bacterium]
MILEQLSVRNFCLYRGDQSFELRPAQRQGKHRPIILFGGINGGGKTTLFDAIQLALYGSRARCSKRSGLAYDDFLRQSIHQGTEPADGAGVNLTFRYVTDGQEHVYEVRRAWQVQDGRVRESLAVYQDGLYSSSLSGSWPQVAEELIPLEISQLFFFDGEKIRSLAEDASSSAALAAAVKALLGLDIVERLVADAAVLQARLAKQAGPPETRAEAGALEERLRALQAQIDALRTERTSLENRRERAEVEQKEAEELFASVGGKHWEQRQQRRARLAELAAASSDVEAQLLALAGGELPLVLASDLLADVAAQADREHEADEAALLGRLLAERDGRLLEALRRAQVPPALLGLVQDHLGADRQARQATGAPEMRLALSDGARKRLPHLLAERLPGLREQTAVLLERVSGIEQEREDLERSLAVTPADADVGQVVERLKAATQALTRLNDQALRLDDEIGRLKTELADCEKKLGRLWQGDLAGQFDREDRLRLVGLAARTRDTMSEFLRRATANKIDRLSLLITESFRYLLRKQTLVERVHINPDDFAITVYDAAGAALPRHRLSEGEKQIFAVAILWGLARASARPLPAVIDTPMARLDAAHRRHLVERYFPNASHQVILFSTDTEVDRDYYEALLPALARAYHLSYDEQAKRTVGEEGYFWKE